MYMFNPGYIAFFFGTFAFIPQVVEVYRTNDTKALSFNTLVLFFISQIFWFAHSLKNHDIALGCTSGVNMIVYSYLVYKKHTNDTVDKTQRTTGKRKSNSKSR
jgi:uncharacterized protein with PQ loop repeat